MRASAIGFPTTIRAPFSMGNTGLISVLPAIGRSIGIPEKKIEAIPHWQVAECFSPIERAVLDARLKLRGVDGLWVADASAMPKVPRGHTNAPTAMIAARAAEWIGEIARASY